MAETSPPSIKKLNAIILLLFSTFLITASAKSPRLVTKLIHRDSIQSPFYNLNATARLHDGDKRQLRTSLARFAYLLGIKLTNENDYRAGVFPDDAQSMFMVNISIGEPPVPQLLNMDTGSNLLWFQCLPCTNCFKQFYPIFDPSMSSTYANLSCRSLDCFNGKCDSSDHCVYNMGYLDGTTTIGSLALEKLTFETSDEGISNISDILIGCGHDNANTVSAEQFSGILGLGPEEDMSLAFRLGAKFSYCIGDIRDPNYAFNNLILGDDAIIEGNLSPLEFYRRHYYVNLEGISVGEKNLDIDPNIFKITLKNGGVIIDSGATYTFLARGAYEPLRNEVQSLLNGVVTRLLDPNNPSHLCYAGNISRDLTTFPMVTFHFAGGAELVLDVYGMFIEYGPGEFCMAVMENPFNMYASIIGVMAQQSYNVAYDLIDKTISFQNIDCRLLEL